MRALTAILSGVLVLTLDGPVRAVESYDACLTLVAEDPERAVREAGDWSRFGGGPAAQHCYALALLEIGAPNRAIDQLLDLAAEAPDLTPEARADILVQAGELLVDEGDTVTAEVVALQALRLVPNGQGALALRASVQIAKGAYSGAIADLSDAIERYGPSARILALRASAYRQDGQLIPARDDASFATELAPGSASAWLERGRVEARIGNRAAARDSLLRAIDLDRGGEISAKAQNIFQRMEAGIE